MTHIHSLPLIELFCHHDLLFQHAFQDPGPLVHNHLHFCQKCEPCIDLKTRE